MSRGLTMKLAILSDLHAVADTTERALEAARTEGFDRLIILGDILTYGVQPKRTLDLVSNAVARDNAILILGNHDQLYLDLDKGETGYYDRLNEWIRESVDWTRAQLEPRCLDALPWRESWASGQLFVAHANPYDYGDWTYLRTDQELGWACRILAKRDFRWGVFGHTHRAVRLDKGDETAATIGSLGQPRDRKDRRPQWAAVEFDDDIFKVEARPVEFDVKQHLAEIAATSMGAKTKERLAMFFQ